MKIKLLNSGGYRGMRSINFPVVVEAERVEHPTHYQVPLSVLASLGYRGVHSNKTTLAWMPEEVEVLP